MKRTYDRDRSAHRPLKVRANGFQVGRDVKELQRSCNDRMRPKSRAWLRLLCHGPLKVDGVYGARTNRVVTTVGRFEGMRMGTSRGGTVYVQKMIRQQVRRKSSQLKRAARYARSHSQTSARDLAVKHALSLSRRHIVERPPGSNSGPYITAWQKHTARGGSYLYHAPWCGIFLESVCAKYGVKTIPQWASVAAIEDYARQKRGGFKGYHSGFNTSGVRPGDLVILFGRGAHVEIIIEVHSWGFVTVGGNTSFEGSKGSQSNGGCVARRNRSRNDVHGIALVAF